MSPAVRQAIENEIERLIGMLDTLDPDPDLEDDGTDEPYLGTVESINSSGWSFNIGSTDDRECDDDFELSLGAMHCAGHVHDAKRPVNPWSQVHWSQGSNMAIADECELACEDEGAQCEDGGAISPDRPVRHSPVDQCGWAFCCGF